VRKDGNRLVIGAMTRHAEIAVSDVVKAAMPALAMVAAGIGDRQVRNMGTIGGSLANNDPAADWPAAVLGAGATIRTNARMLPADAFFKGMFETALAPDEIITAVEFPIGARAGYAKFPNPASRFALVGVFVSKAANGDVRVAVTGAAPSVFRASAIESALRQSFTPDAAKGVRRRRGRTEQRPARVGRLSRASGVRHGGARRCRKRGSLSWAHRSPNPSMRRSSFSGSRITWPSAGSPPRSFSR
jgi:carbon-monoxide dehydrogenase medium subunit